MRRKRRSPPEFLKLVDVGSEIFCRTLLELRDADVAEAVCKLFHTHGLRFDGCALNCEGERLHFTLTSNFKTNFCFWLAAHTLHGFFERQVGSGFAVKLRNDVAGANACSRCRGIVDRRDHAYAGDIFSDFNAEAAETPMCRFTHVFKAFWVKEA